jgi:hypothetical protein
MMRLKMRAMLALAAAMSVASFASAAGVLDKVPDGAWNVVKFSNLAATNKKVGALSEKLGLTFFRPEFADPLGTLKKELKLTNGLQEDGELAIVMVDPKGGRPEQSFMFIVPTSDFKALVGNIQGATTEGEFTVVKQGRQTTYFADWGGYAAVSQNKALLAAPSKGLSLQKRAGEKWEKGDIVIYSNFDAMRETLTKSLAEAHAKAQVDAPEDLKQEGKVEEKYHPALLALMDQGFGVADAFLRDAQATTISYTLTDAGISSSLTAEFKPGSYLANTVNSIQTTNESLLTGLPADSFGAFMGFLNSPDAFAKVIDDLANPVLEKLPADDELSGKLKSFLTESKTLTSKIKSVRSASLDNGPVGTPEQKVTIIDVTDADFLKDAQAFNQKYSESLMQVPSKMTGVDWTQNYTVGAKTIDGVSFDLVKTEITGDSDEATQLRQMLKTTQGTDTMENYIGQVGNTVLGFSNASDETVSALITSAKAGGAPLAAKENNKLSSDALPKDRFAEFYLTGDPIFKTAIRMAPLATGMPLPADTQVQLPPDLPPIAMSLSKQDGSLEVDSFISTDLMQAMMTAGLQLGAEMMQGGGGGRNNGGI